jgi:hypothetical protein
MFAVNLLVYVCYLTTLPSAGIVWRLWWKNECGWSIGGMILAGKNLSTLTETVPVPLGPLRQVLLRVLRFSPVSKRVLIVYWRLISICYNVHIFSLRSVKLAALPRQLFPNHATLFRHRQTHPNMKVMFSLRIFSVHGNTAPLNLCCEALTVQPSIIWVCF